MKAQSNPKATSKATIRPTAAGFLLTIAGETFGPYASDKAARGAATKRGASDVKIAEPTSDRSKAAKRSWQTRDVLNSDRSASALKAWETRRAS